MGLQENLNIIRKIFPKIKDNTWILIGSTNLALQGVDVEAKDIDILTDEKNAYMMGEILKEYTVEPIHFKHTDIFDSYYGKFIIDNVELEIIGITKEDQRDVEGYRIYTKIGEYMLPICDLKRELDAYIKLGRKEKANLIKKRLLQN